MKKLFLSAAALGVFFTACKDDKTNPAPADAPVKLISKVIGVNDSILFDYDANRHLALYEAHQLEEGNIIYVKPVYEDNKVTKLMTGATSSSLTLTAMTFQYNSDGKVLSAVSFDPDDATPNQFDSVAYDGNGRVAAVYTAEKTTAAGHMDFFEKRLFEWDAKGNVAKRYEIRIANETTLADTITTVFTYDDKVNFQAKQAELFLFDLEEVADALSANNMLTEERTASTSVQTTTVEYTYDEENYPLTTKRVTKWFFEGVESSTMEERNSYTFIKK